MFTIFGYVIVDMRCVREDMKELSQTFNHNFTDITSDIASIDTSLGFILEDLSDIKKGYAK